MIISAIMAVWNFILRIPDYFRAKWHKETLSTLVRGHLKIQSNHRGGRSSSSLDYLQWRLVAYNQPVNLKKISWKFCQLNPDRILRDVPPFDYRIVIHPASPIPLDLGALLQFQGSGSPLLNHHIPMNELVGKRCDVSFTIDYETTEHSPQKRRWRQTFRFWSEGDSSVPLEVSSSDEINDAD